MINNQPDPTHWSHIISPELWEAVALVCDIEPRNIIVHRDLVAKAAIGFSLDHTLYNQERQDLFFSMLEIAKNNLSNLDPVVEPVFMRAGIEHRYQIKVSLITFINWTKSILKSKGAKVPAWLLKLAKLKLKDNPNDHCGAKERKTNARILRALLDRFDLASMPTYKIATMIATQSKESGYTVSRSAAVPRVEEALKIKSKTN